MPYKQADQEICFIKKETPGKKNIAFLKRCFYF